MPESTMICLDNSEWMRNGDYMPTRLDAQQDAANLLSTTKCDLNPENTVGLLTMGRDRVELLASPTEDAGRLLSAIATVALGGKTSVCSGIAIARLALKHRRNKNGDQRIIVFVGSPVRETLPELKKAGKMLRRYNVGLDVVSMGEVEDNEEKLRVLVEAASSKDANDVSNSHLITVPPGVIPSDVLISSPVLQQGFGGGFGDVGAGAAGVGAGAGGAAGGAPADFIGGIDPSLDPEMAMALRVSMEEYEAQERAAKAAAEVGDGADAAPEGALTEEGTAEASEGTAMDVEGDAPPAPTSAAAAEPAPKPAAAGGEDDEDALLQQALAMSMTDAPEGMDEDAALRLAMQMSTEDSGDAPAAEAAPAAAATTENPEFINPEFVSELLQGYSGVDPQHPDIQAALSNVNRPQDGAEGKKEEDGDNPDGADKK